MSTINNKNEELQKEMKEIGMRLAALRKDLTQLHIACEIGCSQSQYEKYENGINKIPFNHIVNLAKYFKVSTDSILLGKESKKNEIYNEVEYKLLEEYRLLNVDKKEYLLKNLKLIEKL